MDGNFCRTWYCSEVILGHLYLFWAYATLCSWKWIIFVPNRSEIWRDIEVHLKFHDHTEIENLLLNQRYESPTIAEIIKCTHFAGAQFKVENVVIFSDVIDPLWFRDGAMALLKLIANKHLRRCFFMWASDFTNGLVRQQNGLAGENNRPAWRSQWTESRDVDGVLATKFLNIVLNEKWMAFDLQYRWNDAGGQYDFQLFDIEVRNADISHDAFLLQFLHLSPRVFEIGVWETHILTFVAWPKLTRTFFICARSVHQKQIDIVQLQTLQWLKTPRSNQIRPMECVP